MIIIRNNIIPTKGYKIMNFLGLILFVKKDANVTDIDLNHEAIHTAQYKELWYIGFLFLYIYYYVRLAWVHSSRVAYRNIPFEKEAYENEKDLNYLNTRIKNAWKNYIRI